MNMMGGESDKKVCGCPHHKMLPMLVVLFGLTFLLGALHVLSFYTVNITWPVIIILAGLMKMMKGMCKCCNND